MPASVPNCAEIGQSILSNLKRSFDFLDEKPWARIKIASLPVFSPATEYPLLCLVARRRGVRKDLICEFSSRKEFCGGIGLDALVIGVRRG